MIKKGRSNSKAFLGVECLVHKMQGEALCRTFIMFSTLANVFICGRQAALAVAKEIVCEVYFTLLFWVY